jgi:hypothetical protein
MSRGAAITEVDFTKAKSGLSALVTEVLREHRPFVLRRQGDSEQMAGITVSDLLGLLDRYHFDPQIEGADKEIVASLSSFGVVASGDSVEEAVARLADELDRYAVQYMERRRFFEQTNRAGEFPYLLRFLLTPLDERVELLFSDSEALNPVETPSFLPA